LRFTPAVIEAGAALSAIEAVFQMQLSEPQKA
jgi:hypothetical protein